MRSKLGSQSILEGCKAGVENLIDGTELRLAYLQFADTSLTMQPMMQVVDHPAFTALQSEIDYVLDGPPKGMPQDRGIEFVLENGDRPMLRTRPVNRQSEGEVAELRRLLIDLLDRWWIQPSITGYCSSVIFARLAGQDVVDDYRGLNAI